MSGHNKPLFAFFGTPRFAVQVLDALEKRGLLPALVICAPDKPRGRGQEVSASPAREWAQARGIDVLTPSTLKDEQLVAELQNTDWDVFVVAAYGKLIPKNILEIPRRGALNIHPSLLPKFRGPSPVLSAILADERATGVTIMEMSEQMDAGPVVAQAKVELEETGDWQTGWPPKGSQFEDLLATEGGTLLAETLPEWLAGTLTPEPQDESLASYTKKFTDEDARIDMARSNLDETTARESLLKIRAFDKNPRAYFLDTEGKRVVITDAKIHEGTLEILTVIPEGKKEIPFKTYLESRGQNL